MKSCNRCKKVKQFDEFTKSSSSKDGHYSICKACRKQYRQDNKEMLSRKDRERYIKEGAKLREYQKIHRQKNLEIIKKRELAYRDKPENRERARKRAKEYYLNNKEKAKEATRLYRNTPKGKAMHNNSSSKRRASIKSQTPKLSKEEKDCMTEIYKVSAMLSEVTGVKYHVDHIIPISKGGLHHPDNLRVITATENLKKGNKICLVEKN